VGDLLIDFFIFLILVCLVAAVVLWAVRRFFSDIYEPARYVVGAVALVVILYALRPLVSAILPGAP
jgi:hypothetical protein